MYELKLEKQTISEILGKDFSEYLLPSIQREFVWDEDDIKQMIESILNGYPIGIITIFKTDLEFPSTPLIDVNTKEKNTNEKFYILDGQQRLTSLLMIREKWKIKRNGEIIERVPILYNPDERKLKVKGKRSSGQDFADLINMCLFRQEPKPHLQRVLEFLKNNFLDRPVAFYIVEVKKDGKNNEEVYNDMAQIFTRINRAGIRLGNLEMFLSFFASSSIGKDEIIKLHKELNNHYSMDLEPVIRFIFSNFGLSQHQISKIDSFKRAMKDIKDRYQEQDVKRIIENSGKSITLVMNMLKKELGISTTQILPSEIALVPLFKYVYNRRISNVDEITENESKRMIRWLILASFNGLYSSRTDTRLESDIKILNENINGFPINELLNSMNEKIKISTINENDFKNININILRGTAGKKYLFALYVLLVRNCATDWAGNLISEKAIDEIARHHIFPKEELRGMQDEININHIGNLTFIDKGKNEEIQDLLPEEYLLDFDPDVLQKHFIPIDKNLWKVDNYENFLDERIRLMWNCFNDFMKNLKEE
jgi:hypothetical protein